MKTQLKGMAEKSLHAAPDNKRAQFAKDLDKLISGDYVLVPKNPDAAMEKAGIEAGAAAEAATTAGVSTAAAYSPDQKAFNGSRSCRR